MMLFRFLFFFIVGEMAGSWNTLRIPFFFCSHVVISKQQKQQQHCLFHHSIFCPVIKNVAWNCVNQNEFWWIDREVYVCRGWRLAYTVARPNSSQLAIFVVLVWLHNEQISCSAFTLYVSQQPKAQQTNKTKILMKCMF